MLLLLQIVEDHILSLCHAEVIDKYICFKARDGRGVGCVKVRAAGWKGNYKFSPGEFWGSREDVAGKARVYKQEYPKNPRGCSRPSRNLNWRSGEESRGNCAVDTLWGLMREWVPCVLIGSRRGNGRPRPDTHTHTHTQDKEATTTHYAKNCRPIHQQHSRPQHERASDHCIQTVCRWTA